MTIGLSFERKQRESSNQRSKKRQQEEIEDLNPAVIVSQASTATITEETVSTNPNLLSPFSIQTYQRNIDTLAITVSRLNKKSTRYTSHKDFLSQCINSKLVLRGLELTLESTIGNYDQSFIDNWHSKLKDFYLNLMEDVFFSCDKTVKETNTKIDQTQGVLKQQLGKNEYEKIQKAIKSNKASTKKNLTSSKFKKFNN